MVVAGQADGLVVRGEPAAVERFTERVKAAVRSVDPEQAMAVLTNLQSALDALPDLKRKGEQTVRFEFAPRSVELLKQHGAIPTGDGFFRSMVHDGSSIAGNLDWKPIPAGPELLQLQTAAVTLALQASIKNLADAVERVEQKVDDIRDLIRTDQVGQVVAHHRVLTPLAESVIGGDVLTATDWDSVADLRPEIVATVERTRLYLTKRLSAAEFGWTAQSRSSQATKLIEAEFSNTLALLAAAEHNLASWHRLRVERVRTVEPQHLERTIADVDRELTQQRQLDAELVDALADFIRRVGTPTGYEGLEPIARRRLVRHTEAMTSTVTEFAARRTLDPPDIDAVVMPSLTDSIGKVRDVTTDRARKVTDWTKRRSEPITKPVGDVRRRVGLGRRGSETKRDPPEALPAAADAAE